MPTPVVVGDRTFPSKKAALAEFDRIRVTYPPDTDIIGADRDLIIAGMRCDEVGRSKMGRGLSRLYIRVVGGNRVIWLRDLDGRETDWSPGRAVALAETPRARAHRYLRKAIQPQIEEYRQAMFANPPTICELTELLLRDDRTTVVDHYDPPFAQLADVFLDQIGGPDNLAVIKRDRYPGTTVTEPHLTAWWSLHYEHAHLRLLHTSANGCRGYADDEPVRLGDAIELVQQLLGGRVIDDRESATYTPEVCSGCEHPPLLCVCAESPETNPQPNPLEDK